MLENRYSQREKILKALKDTGLADQCPINEVFDGVFQGIYEFCCTDRPAPKTYMFKITGLSFSSNGNLRVFISIPQVDYLQFNEKEWLMFFRIMDQKSNIGTIEPVSGWFPGKEEML